MTKDTKRKIITVVGPTASGKTSIGVQVCKEFNGEVVSADSRQVYRGLDLGTGKDGVPSQKWTTNKTNHEKSIEYLRDCLRYIDSIPQWMIDICEPGEQFNLFDYLPLAREAIEDIFSRGKTPIIVGGTGLYVQALLEGFELKREERREKREEYGRDELDKKSKDELKNLLQSIDHEAFELLSDKENPHRLIRSIERAQEGLTMTKKKPDFEVLQIGISWPKEELDKRIDERVDERFQQGMLEEVEGLLKSGVDPEWLQGLGLEYRIITEFILRCRSEQSEESSERSERAALWPRSFVSTQDDTKNDKNTKEYKEMTDLLKTRIHQYAKRQMTWFKRFPEFVWEKDYPRIKSIIENFL